MIAASHLTKRFGDVTAVDDLSFEVQPGLVTGFLGPNGAGKSTTMGMILGLDAPTKGRATINGVAYRDLAHPLRSVGALLDPEAVDPKRSAADHLRWLAVSNQIPLTRVDEVLHLVDLDRAAGRPAGALSLGMRQRLGLAAALLGDPETLLFDEPINGLDPEGIVWLRGLLRQLADEGRTVFLSSHLMGEMALTADHLVVIAEGRLVADGPVDEIVRQHTRPSVIVRSPNCQDALASLVTAAGADTATSADGALTVTGLDALHIGQLAAQRGIALSELTPTQNSLEEAFMDMTRPTQPATARSPR
ncbi:ABC transporter ATP-binding protein [Aquihabitans daechungensis]|uniref:ABC transporter ATP-binding protein n=1 Tax=Aquihabitans daechungensis TaxID=1052257 RepID=UPI003B9F6705